MSLVMPIIVMNSGTHENVIRAATLACFASYVNPKVEDRPAFDQWLLGPFTKSVRRAKEKDFFNIGRSIPSAAFCAIGQTDDLGLAMAYTPMEEPFPKLISRCQVAGTEMKREGWDAVPTSGFVLALNPNVTMSTGKTAAQCAHAYLGYHIAKKANPGLRIVCDIEAFETLKNFNTNSVRINDAGNTEVEPGTLTVIAGVL